MMRTELEMINAIKAQIKVKYPDALHTTVYFSIIQDIVGCRRYECTYLIEEGHAGTKQTIVAYFDVDKNKAVLIG